ncbi:MAG: insulinase family protein [Acidobacteria bacterium]|nr:insulinase family protein [Acidobacteriota bacterium]
MSVALALIALAQSLPDFEKRVTEFTLPNGLHFILLERHQAPVVAFHTYVNAGSVDDPAGKTGIAHMFEHMAFKGTPEIGTANALAERKSLEAVEKAYDALAVARAEPRPDAARLKTLEEQLGAAIEKAEEFVEQDLYTRILEENGTAGLNASTNTDSTNYFSAMPANRMELWFLMESQRFLRPVMRQFYKERDVVREEHRMRIESSPQGKLINELTNIAFAAHPYRVGPAGWASDIEELRVADADDFRKRFYVPANMTIAIAGDASPAEVKRLAVKYFGPLPKAPLPVRRITAEPEQSGERRAAVESPSEPLVAIGYKRPDQHHADDPVFDVIDGLLSGGRTGIFHKELVRDKQLALGAYSAAAFPGGKYPNLFLIFLAPNAGRTVAELEKAVTGILERLAAQPAEEAALKRVKTTLRAGLIRQLDTNTGMAEMLASFHVNYGSWKVLFTGLDDIEKVTPADVQRVAKTYFRDRGKTVVYISAAAPAEVKR